MQFSHNFSGAERGTSERPSGSSMPKDVEVFLQRLLQLINNTMLAGTSSSLLLSSFPGAVLHPPYPLSLALSEFMQCLFHYFISTVNLAGTMPGTGERREA